MNLKDRLKQALNAYQRYFFYALVAKNEALKPLGLWNEALLVVTYLEVRGYHPNVFATIGSYIAIVVLAIIFGKVIVGSGVLKYMSTINNHQNPEFMKIIKQLERIEKKLNEKETH